MPLVPVFAPHLAAFILTAILNEKQLNEINSEKDEPGTSLELLNQWPAPCILKKAGVGLAGDQYTAHTEALLKHWPE